MVNYVYWRSLGGDFRGRFKDMDDLLTEGLILSVKKVTKKTPISLVCVGEGVFRVVLGVRSRGIRGYLPAGVLAIEIMDGPDDLEDLDDRAGGVAPLAELHL